MKKVALISAILFFIVYFWANTFMPEDDSGVGIYPAVAANPVTETNIIDEALLNRIMEAEAPAETEAPSGAVAPSQFGALSGAVALSESGAPSKVKATSEPGGGYYLIVASFRDIDQAQLVAEKYTNDYNADIIILPPTPQGYYRISYGRYSTPEEAGATLPAVRETVNPDAWVYSMKKPR